MKEFEELPEDAREPKNENAGARIKRMPNKEGIWPLTRMRQVAAIHIANEHNENIQFKRGMLVSLIDAQDAVHMERELGSTPPYVIAAIKGTKAYIVTRQNYKEGMALPKEQQYGMGEEEELASEDLSVNFSEIDLSALRIYSKPKVIT